MISKAFPLRPGSRTTRSLDDQDTPLPLAPRRAAGRMPVRPSFAAGLAMDNLYPVFPGRPNVSILRFSKQTDVD